MKIFQKTLAGDTVLQEELSNMHIGKNLPEMNDTGRQLSKVSQTHSLTTFGLNVYLAEV